MNRDKEAFEVLKKMASINKVTFKTNYTIDWMQEFTKFNSNSCELAEQTELSENENKSVLRDLCFPRVNFFKFFLLFILWNSLSMNYVGVALGVTSVLNVNPYLMFSLAALFEFIGAAICSLNHKMGQKHSLTLYLILLGMSTFLVAFLPEGDTELSKYNYLIIVKMGVSLVARAMVSAAFTTIL
jgi:hypothetical protein